MSDFLLPKSAPRLPQETLEKTLVVLRQPFALAVFASIAVHGVIWAVAPLLPAAKSPEIDTSRQVNVVELSPSEQLRLPDFANPQVTFPPLSAPTQQPSTTTTQLAPAPSSQSPAASPSFNDPLYNFPIIAPPPPVVWPSLDLPPIFNPPKRVTTQQVSPPKKTPTTPTPDKTSSTQTSTSTDPPSETKTPAPEASTPAQVRPDKIPQAAIAALQAEQKKAVLRRTFAFNPANTTEGDQLQNAKQFSEFATAASEGKLKDGSAGWNLQSEISNVYPSEACLLEVKGVALVAALVQPDGKLAEQPTILRSSGYKPLDDMALKHVAEQTFKSDEQYRVMTFPFRFAPTKENCPTETPKPPA